MKINLLVFGQIAELMGESNHTWQNVNDTEELVSQLRNDYPQLDKMEFSIAVNKKIIHEKTVLENNDVVAVLPPFSGG